MMRFFRVLISIMALTFISCESIEEYSEDEIIEGNLILAAIKEMAFGDGDKAIIETGDESIYYYSVADQETAEEFVSTVTAGEYSLSEPNFELPAGMGEVKVQNLNIDECYYTVDFDVVSLPQRRYILASNEYIESALDQIISNSVR